MSSAQRTLVKSPPELWAEVSEPESLARHLEPFGEVRITRLEPETTVAWEGDRARGTVELEASGWGTKVVLTAEQDVEPAPEPATSPTAERAAEPRRSWLDRLLRRAEPAAPAPAVAAAAEPAPAPEVDAEAVLTGVLDELGSASRRPFAR